MSHKIKLCNGQTVKLYGNYSKEQLKEIKKIRNQQVQEQQSRADIQRDEILKCKFCNGNGCTGCGW